MSKQVVSEQLQEGVKCPACNWETSTLFGFEGQDLDKIGMCGHCFATHLETFDYEIKEETLKEL